MYSTWDVIGVVYWPSDEAATLTAWTSEVPGTAEARRSRPSARWWWRLGRIFRPRPEYVSSAVLLVFVVMACAVGAWFAAAFSGNFRAPLRGHLPAWFFWGVASVVGAGFIVNMVRQRSALGERALVIRRLREEGFVRRIRPGFAEDRQRPMRPGPELTRRADHWRGELKQPPTRGQMAPYLASRPIVPLVMTGAFVCWMAVLGVPAIGRVFQGNGLLWLVWSGLLVGALARSWTAMELVKRARASLRLGRCPDCGYDLAGVPGVSVRDGERAVSIGPRRCPECGAPWPLLPPAIASAPRARLFGG